MRSWKCTTEEYLFFAAWIIFLAVSLFCETAYYVSQAGPTLQKLTRLIRYCTYVLCCARLLYSMLRGREIAQMILTGVVAVVGVFSAGNQGMLLSVLFVLAAVGVQDEKIIRLTALIQGLVLFVVVGLSQLGILQDYIFNNYGMRMRHGLGFSWTTAGPMLYFYFLLCYLILRKRALKIWEAAILEAVAFFFYRMTDTRMVFYLTTVVLVVFLIRALDRRNWKIEWKLDWFLCLVPWILCVASIFMMTRYDSASGFWRRLNTEMSDRLSLGKTAIETYGFSLFGRPIEWIGYSINQPSNTQLPGKYNYVDCSYLRIALEYGALVLIAILLFYSVAIYRLCKCERYDMVIALLCVLLIGVTEPHLMNLVYNPLPLLAFAREKNAIPT